ncbi:PepSY-associated TM helix domain-containing protein [Methylobacterium sp. J-068]|uniref:PepSY-associated TM helix domain-containing protein n=1 Tax=Methylobacterium sp. J-068 TaxID=2836649 RepID=UPI001FB98DD2|nr:PepSY-associated TM helix domain-containing protein [Methylobacterium sp. J-068]MCJ2034888.1 PepSY domain-containing protein [Methylobacterium sp. J-068]
MKRLRAVLFQLHWLLGLGAGLVLAVAGVTGALLSYEDAIGEAIDADLIHVDRRSEDLLTPDALLARFRSQRPEGVANLTLPAEPGTAVMARLARDPASGQRPPSLYLDPYDGTVRGAARTEEAFATIRRLHRWLLLPGDGKGWGRILTGVSTLVLLVLLGTGLYLRWPKVMSLRIWLKPHLRQWGRPTYWSLHAVAGTWVLPIYVVIALSGLWWSFDWYRDAATVLLTGGESAARAAAVPMRPAAGQERGAGGGREAARGGEGGAAKPGRGEEGLGGPGAPPLDTAWAAFCAADAGHFTRATLLMPSGPSGPVRIRSENRNGWRDDTRIEARTGRILAHEVGGERPLGARIAGNMLDLHSGRIFGRLGPPVFLLAALLMPLFLVTGLLLYLGRRAAKARRRAGAAAPVRIATSAIGPRA